MDDDFICHDLLLNNEREIYTQSSCWAFVMTIIDDNKFVTHPQGIQYYIDVLFHSISVRITNDL